MIKSCLNCGNRYETQAANSKYCNNKCCIEATQKRKKGLVRVTKGKRKCAECNTLLSQYNHNDKCWLCQHSGKDVIEGLRNDQSN